MKKFSFSLVAMLGLLATSCSSDEPMAPLSGANTQIGYNVTATNGSRGTSNYENGTDVNSINVSAWAIAPKRDNDGNLILDENGKFTFTLPGYDYPNTGNSYLFINDVLTRSDENGKKGTFNYATDARYWPNNDEIVDFYAMVDNDKAWGEAGVFGFTKVDDKPGTDVLTLLTPDKMPDMLFAATFDETLKKNNHQNQQNVSFSFDHAFAKVVVTAEVRNNNLHVVLNDISFHGIAGKGQFCMPYKSGSGNDIIKNPAHWIVSKDNDNYVSLPVAEMTPAGADQTKDKVVLDIYEGKNKEYLIGGQTKANPFNDVLVIPSEYSGRNGSSIQTYIELTGYAYNKAGDELDEDTDMLIYGEQHYLPGGNRYVTPVKMRIPIEFDWAMGTINKYNIVFDCANGGNIGENPTNPAFVRIGYEVEVKDWTDVDNGDYEYPTTTGTNHK